MASYDQERKCWRLRATTSAPGRPRRRKVRDFHAPNTAAGRRLAEAEEVRFRDSCAAQPAYAGSFAEFVTFWIDRHRTDDWTPRTTAQVEHTVARHINPHIGAKQLADIDPEDIERMYTAWATAKRPDGKVGYDRQTRRRWHGIVRAVFSTALRLRRLDHDPMHHVDPAGSLKPTRPARVPTVAEVEAVLAECSESMQTFVLVAAMTGARRGSILNLRWRDVDLETRTLFFGVTKEDRPYTVAIDDRLVAELRAARLRATETALALGLGGRMPELYVFSKDGGLSHWNESWPSHAWRVAADALGLHDVKLHGLRHFHASTCLANRISHADVAHRLGCTEANVLKTYSHRVDSDADRRASDIVAGLFNTG